MFFCVLAILVASLTAFCKERCRQRNNPEPVRSLGGRLQPTYSGTALLACARLHAIR